MSRELVSRLSKHASPSAAQPLGHAVDSVPYVSIEARQKAYRRSHLANQHAVRRPGAEIGAPKRRDAYRGDAGANAAMQQRVKSGQNRPSAGFQGPKGRGYNPYA